MLGQKQKSLVRFVFISIQFKILSVFNSKAD